ncbi:hypothetical protein [Salinigranum marinum]|uniref:hypothetical protein n=1 Tax=Salinigranum marinum TaxID=1515595 RepID=UPI002989CB17|nr:hypothetical protein [Salinigranum marinum]
MRSEAFLLLGLLVLAGCTGSVTDGSTASSPGVERTPTVETTTATATPFPNTTVAFPAGPKSRQALLETITAETAREYVVRHEYRYSYNELWSGPETEVGMSDASCGVRSTEPEASGYVVTVRCTAYVNEPSSGDTTRTRHADLPPWNV